MLKDFLFMLKAGQRAASGRPRPAAPERLDLDTTHCVGALAHQRQMGAGLALEHTRHGDLQLLLRVGRLSRFP
jgi:hypothetical protein